MKGNEHENQAGRIAYHSSGRRLKHETCTSYVRAYFPTSPTARHSPSEVVASGRGRRNNQTSLDSCKSGHEPRASAVMPAGKHFSASSISICQAHISPSCFAAQYACLYSHVDSIYANLMYTCFQCRHKDFVHFPCARMTTHHRARNLNPTTTPRCRQDSEIRHANLHPLPTHTNDRSQRSALQSLLLYPYCCYLLQLPTGGITKKKALCFFLAISDTRFFCGG